MDTFEAKYECMIGPKTYVSKELEVFKPVRVDIKHSNLYLMVQGDATFESLDALVESVRNDIADLRKACDVKITLSLARSYLKSKPHYQIPSLLPVQERFMKAIFGEDYSEDKQK